MTMASPNRLDPNAPGRAVVLGASLAGLLAARVLSDHFGEVLLLERDELPASAMPRKGTPQAVHPHGLLARGREVL
jgi:flavin-dependent dehydrogenase